MIMEFRGNGGILEFLKERGVKIWKPPMVGYEYFLESPITCVIVFVNSQSRICPSCRAHAQFTSAVPVKVSVYRCTFFVHFTSTEQASCAS